jgi:Cytochrome c7 and related cytochrome c
VTRHGRLALVALVAMSLSGPGVAPAHAQVSPGPLSAAHEKLDGATQCFQCHAKAGGPAEMEQRCLACHTEIAWMKSHREGFHAQVKDPCSKCHPDHAGRDFQMIAWDGGSPQRFDHRRAGWALEGRHAQIDCRSCHKPEFQKSEMADRIRKKDRATSWLGLGTACASCHTDPHSGALGADCARCHGLNAWKPAPRFDHARTAYPLTGAHVTVACAQCHATTTLVRSWAPSGTPIPVYKPVPHGECSSCHSDPHAGKFGPACARCHVTTSFTTVNKSSFDHDRTRYPLRGRHVTVACESCHDEKTAFGPKPGFATCGACHRDAHAGQARVAGKPADCATCHDVNGFTPSIFTVAQHAASVYPLEGAHARVECAKCHTHRAAGDPVAAGLGVARVVMRPARDRCTSCHADPHQGRFTSGPHTRKEGCVACHGMSAFRPSAFDVAAHATSGFPLEGAHRATPCAGCHASLKSPVPGATTASSRALPLDDAPLVCEGCHQDPHGGQFAARKDHGACAGCHVTDAFAPATRFDHSRDARFKLDGAHARAACAACHRPTRDPDGVVRARYHPTPTACSACHASSPAPGAGKSSSLPGDHPDPLVMLALREARHGSTLH